MQRPGQAKVEVVGPRDDIETVKVGGSAVTVLRGELVLKLATLARSIFYERNPHHECFIFRGQR